jgi:hypothetical protein
MCLFMISSTVGVATRSAYQPSKYSADRGFGGIGSLYNPQLITRGVTGIWQIRSLPPRRDTNSALGKRRW